MKTTNRIAARIVHAALFLILGTAAAHALAQDSPLPAPPPVEKQLAARASNVTEVTLGKSMLAFAAKFMDGKDADDAEGKKLIQGLDGIYVRDYEFDKEGQFSADEVEQLRKYFETSDWSPIVKERERKSGETTDVMVKLVNGETKGMFILTVEPKELTIVLILGPVKVEDLGKLHGIAGLGDLSGIAKNTGSDKAKDKVKDKKGGGE